MNVDKPIKVLLIASLYPPDFTGAGLRSHRTFKRIKEKYPLDILVLSRNNKNGSERLEEYEGIPILRIRTGKSLLANICKIGRLFYRNDLKSYDIVYCGGDVYIHLAAALWAKIFSLKLIMEVVKNKGQSQHSSNIKLKEIINYVRHGYIRDKLHKHSHLSVALNKEIKNYFLKLGIPEKRVWLRPNPVDTRIFTFPTKDERTKARKKYGIPDDNFVHLLIGTIKARKNQKFALEYLSKLPGHHVMIVAGPVSDRSYLDELYNSISYKMLNNRVIILTGHQKEVRELYHAADVFAMTSIAEGTPNVMLEALCCGLPVLLNEGLQLEEYIAHGENGWISPLNIDDFVRFSLECEKKFSNHSSRYLIAHNAKNRFNFEYLDAMLYDNLCRLKNSAY